VNEASAARTVSKQTVKPAEIAITTNKTTTLELRRCNMRFRDYRASTFEALRHSITTLA